MRQIQQLLHTVARSLTLLWLAAPRATVFLLVSQALQGLAPAVSVWIVKQVVDTVSGALNQEVTISTGEIASLLFAWIAALLVQSLLPPWVTVVQGNLNEKLMAHINLKLMQKADELQDLQYFEDTRFYDRLQLLREEAAQKPSYLLANLAYLGKELVTILTMVGLLFSLGWWVPALLLIVLIPQGYVAFRLEENAWEVTEGKSHQLRRMEYYSSIMLTDTYAKEVRLFGLGTFLLNRYRRAFADWHQAKHRIRNRRAWLSTASATASTTVNALIFYWVVQQALQGDLSPGNVLLFIQSLAYLEENVGNLAYSPVSLYEALLYMRKLFEFLSSSDRLILNPVPKPAPAKLHSGIRFENVSFHYPDGRLALSNVTFMLRPRETVALVGENGAGKTSLIKLLTRLYDPTSGKIWIDDINLQDIDIAQWRQQVAVVFQDFGRYSFTLGENVAFGDLRASSDSTRLQYAAEQAGIVSLSEQLPQHYQTLLGKQFNGTELSGGQWQKVAIARAFFHTDAQIVILDEPTAALDPRSEYEVYHRFAELAQGKTTLLITHRLASVRMADRILVLKHGKLIEQGTHQDLIRQDGEYTSLWRMQSQQYQA